MTNSSDPSLQSVREEYHAAHLTEQQLLANPIEQARVWLDDAVAQQPHLPNAMVLATTDTNGQPSVRTVLLKGIQNDGFTFFTDYQSRKGTELEANSRVSFVMHWPGLDRQLIVIGTAEKLSAEASRDYFASRPYASQLSAAAAHQSQPVELEELIQQRNALATQHPEGTAVPMPSRWGGYLIRPHEMQFWHGRPSRLHDRFRYIKQTDNSWLRERLAP